MKIVICPDSFKTVATSKQIAQVIKEACYEVIPNSEIHIQPMADGGEGTLDIISDVLSCQIITINSFDPLLRPIKVPVAISSSKKIGIIESASIIGPSFLTFKEKRPLITSSYGLGNVLKTVLLEFPNYHWYVAMGGTSTMDGGKDASEALGVVFLDTDNKNLSRGGGSLVFLDLIIPTLQTEKYNKCAVSMLCDVNTTLTGPKGAVPTFARQKGATTGNMHILAVGFRVLRNALYKVSAGKFKDTHGFGAAGGIPATFNTLFGWDIKWGASEIIKLTNLSKYIEETDIVISGEGKLDEATFNGKVIGEILKITQKHNKPLLIITGKNAITSKFTDKNFIVKAVDSSDTPAPKNIENALAKIKTNTIELLKSYI